MSSGYGVVGDVDLTTSTNNDGGVDASSAMVGGKCFGWRMSDESARNATNSGGWVAASCANEWRFICKRAAQVPKKWAAAFSHIFYGHYPYKRKISVLRISH